MPGQTFSLRGDILMPITSSPVCGKLPSWTLICSASNRWVASTPLLSYWEVRSGIYPIFLPLILPLSCKMKEILMTPCQNGDPITIFHQTEYIPGLLKYLYTGTLGINQSYPISNSKCSDERFWSPSHICVQQ